MDGGLPAGSWRGSYTIGSARPGISGGLVLIGLQGSPLNYTTNLSVYKEQCPHPLQAE